MSCQVYTNKQIFK